VWSPPKETQHNHDSESYEELTTRKSQPSGPVRHRDLLGRSRHSDLPGPSLNRFVSRSLELSPYFGYSFWTHASFWLELGQVRGCLLSRVELLGTRVSFGLESGLESRSPHLFRLVVRG
jgi:hypothetical protein